MDDRIEQQIIINASVDRVWELVTRPGWWVPSTTEDPVDHTPGHRTTRTSEKWGSYVVEVVKVEPQTYAAFRWASAFPGEDLDANNTTLVEFFVAPADDGVEVKLVETGFAGLKLTDEGRASAWSDNTNGWHEMLADLKSRSEHVSVA